VKPRPSPQLNREADTDQPSSTLTTRAASETRQLGRSLAALVQPGDILCLRGELGAGKTTFIQGLAEGLDAPEPATSPSFTFLHEHRGRLLFRHLDLYRVRGDLTEIGLDDIIGDEAVVAVEWSERLPARFCRDALEIEIEMALEEEDTRQITLRAQGPRGARMLRGLTGGSDAPPGH